MSESTRPKRVVIVDVDDPMVEIQGEFFWREDHERLLASAREEAFQRGFAEGYDAVGARPPQVVVRYRRHPLRHLILWPLALLVVVSYLTSLIVSFAH